MSKLGKNLIDALKEAKKKGLITLKASHRAYLKLKKKSRKLIAS